MPQTDSNGLEGYMKRTEKLFEEEKNLSFDETGIVMFPLNINSSDTDEELMNNIWKTCHISDEFNVCDIVEEGEVDEQAENFDSSESEKNSEVDQLTEVL